MVRVNAILDELMKLNAMRPEDFMDRYNLLRTLVLEITQFMNEADREATQESLKIVRSHIELWQQGRKSDFVSTSDEFESVLREYVHNKIRVN